MKKLSFLVSALWVIASASNAMAVTASACTLNNLVGKWMSVKTNTFYGTNTRCILNITYSSGTSAAMTGTCYDRYPDGTTKGGITSSSYALSAGTIKALTAINSCAFTFTANVASSIKISGDIVLAADRYTAHGFFFKDATSYNSGIEGGPFTAVLVP